MQNCETSDIETTVNPLTETVIEQPEHVVIDVLEEEQHDDTTGQYTGQCKWFNDLLGYGFVTICVGSDSGKDIFVHHTGIKPLNSNYRTLKKGEYLSFNIVNGINGLQATDVTGINGGPLMCDFVSTARKPWVPPPAITSAYRPRTTFNGTMAQTSVASAAATSMQPPQQRSYKLDQWHVVTKTGKKKNLAKYSKEGRMAMKAAVAPQV
jgi:CspA family cold shock protein